MNSYRALWTRVFAITGILLGLAGVCLWFALDSNKYASCIHTVGSMTLRHFLFVTSAYIGGYVVFELLLLGWFLRQCLDTPTVKTFALCCRLAACLDVCLFFPWLLLSLLLIFFNLDCLQQGAAAVILLLFIVFGLTGVKVWGFHDMLSIDVYDLRNRLTHLHLKMTARGTRANSTLALAGV